jgi:nicotinate-nucleotide adenylyltransferase
MSARLLPMTLIFGGTFDPVHAGHIAVCEQAQQLLAAEFVRLLPSSVPPHRTQPKASAAQRLAMVNLAIAGRTNWFADDLELRRTGASYTIDTLKTLRAELGESHAIVLLIGADQLQKLDQWRDWQELLHFAHLAVMTRPGAVPPAEVVTEFLASRRKQPSALHLSKAGNFCELAVTPITITATAIRAELAQAWATRGRVWDQSEHSPQAAQGAVGHTTNQIADAVLQLIQAEQLYR